MSIKLNLADLRASDVKYVITKYPDGQQDLQIKDVTATQFFGKDAEVEIQSRLNNFKDLELIICANKALRRKGVERISLYIPYLLGARSDRKFVDGGTSYLVDVLAPILNLQGFYRITSLDVHSDVAAACINFFEPKPANEFIEWAMQEYMMEREVIIVSPDAGSLKKIYSLVKDLHLNAEVVVATKHRDVSTGLIDSTIVPITEEQLASGKDIVVIDDICDGGRTFIEIGKKISEMKYSGKVLLMVTHGIFSKGLEEIQKHYDEIYSTNSYSDHTENRTDYHLFLQWVI